MRTIWPVIAAMAFAGSAAADDHSPEQSAPKALETRLGDKGFESPPATLDQLGWLVGQWEGGGIRGAPAMESWLPPMGGIMVGTFVQETKGEDGTSAIMFTEHLYLMEEEGSLALRLKHFNADLTGWEEKDDMLTFRLVAIEPCAAYFNALTLRCADPERPGEGLVAAVRMKSDKPEVQELLFEFSAVKPRPDLSYGCDGTTYAINQCLARIRDKAAQREKRYFDAAIMNGPGLPKQVTLLERSMRAAQSAAEAMRKEECGSVYEQWKDGTIRNAMALRCEIRLIDQRTHDIWRNWLTFQDSSEPVLPEPAPSR
ncbi:MAG: DUF6265 family protein [Pseudomonadota bacterium]